MKAVEIRSLRKSFGKVKALDGLDLDIETGQVFGIIGPNGSGKTTAIRILCGLLKADGGGATVFGHEAGSRKYLPRIGYMPQEAALYEDLTMEESLKLFARVHGISKREFKENEKKVLEMVDLYDRRDFLISELSGGQKHRISLAASMIHSPDLLFLDEPTVGVDPPLRARFWNTFNELKRSGVTIVMSTHYMDEAKNCDRIAMMRMGRVITQGSPDLIMRRTKTENLENAFLYMVQGEGVMS